MTVDQLQGTVQKHSVQGALDDATCPVLPVEQAHDGECPADPDAPQTTCQSLSAPSFQGVDPAFALHLTVEPDDRIVDPGSLLSPAASDYLVESGIGPDLE